MNYSTLNEARSNVQAARELIAKDDAALRVIEDQIADMQGQIRKLRDRQAAKHLHENLALAERELVMAEETTVEEINLSLANEIMQRQASDPLRHHKWIAESVTRLTQSVRSELDTQVGKKYGVHPLITQALALLPPRDGIDRPVWDLGYQVAEQTDWASRRRAIIAAAEAASFPPLEAA